MPQLILYCPSRAHAIVSLSTQSTLIDVCSLISSFPSDINSMILDHLGANDLHMNNLINDILAHFYRLEKSFYDNLSEQEFLDRVENDYLKQLEYSRTAYDEYMSRDANLYRNQEVHTTLQESVTKEVSELIRIKTLYESITKDYSFVNKCIENLNSHHTHKSNLEVNSIKDMIRNLESYKVWTQKISNK